MNRVAHVALVALVLGGCSPRFCMTCPDDQEQSEAVKAWQVKISSVISEHDRRIVELEKEKENVR
jgi:hypothetical protein